eukprot:scaffold3189_cov141-Skeletonema_menzelii.AAC.3
MKDNMVRYSYLQLAAIGAVFVKTATAEGSCETPCLTKEQCMEACELSPIIWGWGGSGTTQKASMPVAGCFNNQHKCWFGDFGSDAEKSLIPDGLFTFGSAGYPNLERLCCPTPVPSPTPPDDSWKSDAWNDSESKPSSGWKSDAWNKDDWPTFSPTVDWKGDSWKSNPWNGDSWKSDPWRGNSEWEAPSWNEWSSGSYSSGYKSYADDDWKGASYKQNGYGSGSYNQHGYVDDDWKSGVDWNGGYKSNGWGGPEPTFSPTISPTISPTEWKNDGYRMGYNSNNKNQVYSSKNQEYNHPQAYGYNQGGGDYDGPNSSRNQGNSYGGGSSSYGAYGGGSSSYGGDKYQADPYGPSYGPFLEDHYTGGSSPYGGAKPYDQPAPYDNSGSSSYGGPSYGGPSYGEPSYGGGMPVPYSDPLYQPGFYDYHGGMIMPYEEPPAYERSFYAGGSSYGGPSSYQGGQQHYGQPDPYGSGGGGSYGYGGGDMYQGYAPDFRYGSHGGYRKLRTEEATEEDKEETAESPRGLAEAKEEVADETPRGLEEFKEEEAEST